MVRVHGRSFVMTLLQSWLTGDIAAGIAGAKASGREPIYWGGLSPLHLLAQRGSVLLVKMALEAGFDVDARDDYRRTPLMVAASLAKHLEGGAIAQALLRAGAAIGTSDLFGNRALHYAARSGNANAFAALLAAGADPDALNHSNCSSRAFAESRRDLEIMRLLRRLEFIRGGETNAK